MSYRIETVDSYTAEVYQAFERLTSQLADIPTPSKEHLKALIVSETSSLFVDRCSETMEIVGTLTLATYVIPTGTCAWIEDVIVDSSQRAYNIQP